MTEPDVQAPVVRPPAARILDRLPVHVRARDAALGGVIAALADAVGGELAILERDLDTLYASWFVETCPEWVVPYLADLVGVADLPPELPGVTSRRAFVANTVAYRRRKGTVAALELVARDASGWPAVAVEYFRRLAVATHLDHVRTDRPATASLRTPVAAAGPLELVPTAVAQGALAATARTAEVRRIASGAGLYGIPNVAAFLFPAQAYPLGWSPALPPPDPDPDAPPDPDDPGPGWSVHPLGLDTPLFAAPRREATPEELATEATLPVPLRPRRLLALLQAARTAGAASAQAADLPLAVRVDPAANGPRPLVPERVRVFRLENLAHDPDRPSAPLDGWQVMVDAVTGRLYPFLDGAPATPDVLEVQHSYGGTADVGAGAQDRAAVHEVALDGDPYLGDPAHGGPATTRVARVRAGATLADGAVDDVATALTAAETGWAAEDPTPGSTYVIAVGDSARYPAAGHAADLAVTVPAATRLVVVAATAPGTGLLYDPQGLRPRLRGSLTVSGAGGSSVVLDGLVVEGDVVVAAGDLGSLTLASCTVAGRVVVTGTQGADAGLVVRLLRSQCGPVLGGAQATSLHLEDSTLDAGSDTAPAISGGHLALTASGATVRGTVAARTLSASSTVFDGRVTVEDRQVGCLRYSYAPTGSQVPRRFRCAPGPGADPATRPAYVSLDRGSPGYLTLAPGCPAAIAEGGEGDAEMGVHHHLGRPVRVRATSRLLGPYLPVGLELGVRAPVALAPDGAPPTGGS